MSFSKSARATPSSKGSSSAGQQMRANRTFFATTLIVILIPLTGILLTFLLADPQYVLVSLLTSALVFCTMLMLERNARIAKNAAKAGKEATATVQVALDRIAAVESRSKRSERVLRDTAGSVGRSSPIIRRIEASVNDLRSDLQRGQRGSDLSSASIDTMSVTLPPTQKKIAFPEAPKVVPDPVFSDVTVLMIADEFTLRAFAHEWTVVTATPENWKTVIDSQKPAFVFVESAWEAVEGAWKYHLVGQSAPRQSIVDLTAYARATGIPTLFWNKEDPPHFEDFLETARLFDVVCTTDGDKIESYRSRLGHNNVFLLPFAAQPRIHNPGRIVGVQRDRNIVFGGMYFRDKYPERREQLDLLLPAAERLGLDIFSRNDGSDARYRFPEKFMPSVRGALPYSQMISAYHGYKVVINVNSVTTSSSMCARRIFEATACGAAVVSTYTSAIERFFGDSLLTLVSTEAEAFDRIRTLVRSDELRERRVHLAQRQMWEHDTYTHRAVDVMSWLGIEAITPKEYSCSIIVSTNRPQNLPLVVANCVRQSLDAVELVIVTHGFSINNSEFESMLAEAGASTRITTKAIETESNSSLGGNLNRGFSVAAGDYLFRMDDDDFYGENYVRDQLNAIRFSGADLVGKAETYMYFESEDATFLTFPGKSHRYTDFVRGATFAGPRETFETVKFAGRRTGEDSNFLADLRRVGGSIYSADRFNYVVNRHADKTSHTWRVDDTNLMGTGEMRFVGNDQRQVEI